MAKLVSRIYGDALFALAVEQNTTDSLYEEVKMVQAVLKEKEAFEKILMHPEIPKTEKLQIIEQVFRGKTSDALTGFLRIAAAKGRYKDLPDIFAYFIARVKEYKKSGAAEVCSAVPLADGQRQKIEKRLLDTTHYKTMEIDYRVDRSLIGGLMIRIGDRVVDSTIKSKLDKLTASLMKISLESEKEGVQAS